jgi:cytochrome c553
MKSICMIVMAVFLVAVPLSLWSAEDGAAQFKDKCAMCHGDKAEGKPDMKAPALKGTKMTAEKLVTFLTKGEKGKGFHEDPFSSLSAENAKLIANYIKSLK